MDPDKCPDEMRERAASIDENGGSEEDVLRLAELVIALDEWLTKGGRLPFRWKVAQSKKYRA